jgi:2-polyprenyl-6-hydroxyphenyl methylase/3-demethylubiquinone-9 3-methyltransferase
MPVTPLQTSNDGTADAIDAIPASGAAAVVSSRLLPGRAARCGVVYQYRHSNPGGSHKYLWPLVQKIAGSRRSFDRRALDLGCGQGATAHMLGEMFGFSVTGVDPSETGIAIARSAYGRHSFFCASTEDDLAERFGAFPLVVSLEVVSFVHDPQLFAKRVFDLLQPGGVGIVSSPFHGYIKNLALSLTNKWDKHLDPFFPGTMVRFFSQKTFTRLWLEAGFDDVTIVRTGRVPVIAKSMVAILRK